MVSLKIYDPNNFSKVIKEIIINNDRLNIGITIGTTRVGEVIHDQEKVTKIFNKVNTLSNKETFELWLQYSTENIISTRGFFVFYKNKMFVYDDFYKLFTRCPYCNKITKIIDKNRIRGSRKYVRYTTPAEYYCNDCWNNVITKAPLPYEIYNYHAYNRYVKFVKHKTQKDKNTCLQIGVELEMEFGSGGSSESNGNRHAKNARLISLSAGPEFDVATTDMLIASFDCSLRNGFELISQPMSLEYHKNIINWVAALEKAHELGYKSHNGGHCGMHMHVNRDFFSGTKQEAEDKITVIVMNNMYWLKPFSRRKNWEYCRFPSSVVKLKGQKVVLSKDVKEGKYTNASRTNIDCAKRDSGGHGAAMNFHNEKTIEFRFIRGTLLPGTFFASLEMVQMTCEMANMFSLEECANVNLQTYCLFARERGYSAFLKYVNKMEIDSSYKTVLADISEVKNDDGSTKAKV